MKKGDSMKKPLMLLASAFAAMGLAFASSGHATQACSPYIDDGSASYDAGSSTLSGTISPGTDRLVVSAGCKSVAYGAIISYASDGVHIVQSTAQKGDGASP